MAVPWPTHRRKAALTAGLRRRKRRQDSARDKAAHQAELRRKVAGP